MGELFPRSLSVAVAEDEEAFRTGEEIEVFFKIPRFCSKHPGALGVPDRQAEGGEPLTTEEALIRSVRRRVRDSQYLDSATCQHIIDTLMKGERYVPPEDGPLPLRAIISICLFGLARKFEIKTSEQARRNRRAVGARVDGHDHGIDDGHLTRDTFLHFPPGSAKICHDLNAPAQECLGCLMTLMVEELTSWCDWHPEDHTPATEANNPERSSSDAPSGPEASR